MDRTLQKRKAEDRANAKKDGTYVKPKWRPPPMPAYEYAERKWYGCDYIAGNRHCNCDACRYIFGWDDDCSGCERCAYCCSDCENDRDDQTWESRVRMRR